MTECAIEPAESFRHARIFDILVCGETLDKNCDHLHRDVLHEAGQRDGWVKGGICRTNGRK